MSKPTAILALALIALPLTASAEPKKNIAEIPRMANQVCQYHPDKAAYYEYVISMAKMTMALGYVGGICTTISDAAYVASKESCDSAKENIEFVKGVR